MLFLMSQVDARADWDTASEVIYDPQHPDWQEKPDHVMFVHGGFMPAALPYSLQAYGKKVGMTPPDLDLH